jgi:hypothetical protein
MFVFQIYMHDWEIKKEKSHTIQGIFKLIVLCTIIDIVFIVAESNFSSKPF